MLARDRSAGTRRAPATASASIRPTASLRAGEPGVQLTWMDARVGDRVVTPRTGKPVEINALWYNALVRHGRSARGARRGRHDATGSAMAARAAAGFARFWNEAAGHCYDVIDGPGGRRRDASARTRSSRSRCPRARSRAERQRQVVDACARRLLTSYGLRSLAPGDPGYAAALRGRPARARRGLPPGHRLGAGCSGPFALAHERVHGDRAGARAPSSRRWRSIWATTALGSIAEVFDGEPPFAPRRLHRPGLERGRDAARLVPARPADLT